MGKYDFCDNSQDIERVKKVKPLYDEIVMAMISGQLYSEELYEKYLAFEQGIEGIDEAIVTSAGVTRAILEKIKEKHDEIEAENKKKKEEAQTYFLKYVSIIEDIVKFGCNDNVLKEISEFKNGFKSISKDVQRYSNVDLTILDTAIAKEKALNEYKKYVSIIESWLLKNDYDDSDLNKIKVLRSIEPTLGSLGTINEELIKKVEDAVANRKIQEQAEEEKKRCLYQLDCKEGSEYLEQISDNVYKLILDLLQQENEFVEPCLRLERDQEISFDLFKLLEFRPIFISATPNILELIEKNDDIRKCLEFNDKDTLKLNFFKEKYKSKYEYKFKRFVDVFKYQFSYISVPDVLVYILKKFANHSFSYHIENRFFECSFSLTTGRGLNDNNKEKINYYSWEYYTHEDVSLVKTLGNYTLILDNVHLPGSYLPNELDDNNNKCYWWFNLSIKRIS